MKSIFVIILITIFTNSCMNLKTAQYIDNCRKIVSQQENDKYYFTSVNELKNNIKGSRLFYIGSDSSFHYFDCFYDKTYKTKVSFKIMENEFIPRREIIYQKDNSILDGYLIPLSDL